MTTRRLLALLVVVHLVCGGWTAASKTVTHDEIWHLPVGLLHWRTGRFDGDVLNPPLTRLWAAIPAALAGVEVADGVDATDIAQKFVAAHGADVHRWYAWGRLFNLCFSVATGLLLFWWARAWWGDSAAVIAAALFFTCPNVLAHAALVTPDAGLMLAYTATLYLFVRWRRSLSWRDAGWLGVALGLAQATKFTAVLLYPLLGFLALACGSITGSERHSDVAATSMWRRMRRPLGQLGGSLLVSLIVWNACFLFHGTGRSLASYRLESSALQGIRTVLGPLARFPIPLPEDYLVGIDRQRAVMEQPHPSFLDGRWSTSGFPDYFLRTLEYKLPHVLQLAIVVGLLTLLLKRSLPDRRMIVLVLLTPTISLLTLASGSTMQLGVRYVLPVIPLLILTAASAGVWLDRLSATRRNGLLAVITLAALTSLRHHPHHLAYFNEFAGGPVGGRHHLLDSNLDWGQDLHLVKQFMTEHDLDRIGLVYFGTFPAEVLGIDFEISPGFVPTPGWHAVSVNYVMGRPHLLREPGGAGRPADLNEFAYFQAFEPVARLGYSIDMYHIEGTNEPH